MIITVEPAGYIRNLELEQTETERYDVEFQGVNASADVYLDGNHLLHHDGGYSAFRVDLTERVCVGKKKSIYTCRGCKQCSNDFVYPQKADFTFYGGAYRDVNRSVYRRNTLHFQSMVHRESMLRPKYTEQMRK